MFSKVEVKGKRVGGYKNYHGKIWEIGEDRAIVGVWPSPPQKTFKFASFCEAPFPAPRLQN